MAVRRYSLALALAAPLTSAAYAQLLGVTRTCWVRELSIWITAASADVNVGLLRAATVGTASASKTFIPNRTQDPAAVTLLHTAWSAAPTVAGTPAYLRRAKVLSGSTAVISWGFDPMDLAVRQGEGLLLWNYGAGTSSITELLAVIEEEY